ncbi:MAG: M15 family metallopeptidase [Bacteroidia bacterium]|nr:M15 family metallopeptidase [Bacteroidia bacterium]
MNLKLPPILWLFCLLVCIGHGCNNPPKSNVKEDELIKLPTVQRQSEEGGFSLDYVTGKFEPSEHKDFTVIERKYCSRDGMYLRKEAYEAFKRMHHAAKIDGVDLTIISDTRNFKRQKAIWENKWNGVTLVESGQNLSKTVSDPIERALIILKYSSMPGSSRHHWGTDIDINNWENRYFQSGQGLIEYEWLINNAAEFGFCQPYTQKDENRPNGYNEEKWHWSYMPLAKQLTEFASKNFKNSILSGFDGGQTAEEIDILNNYILGISQSCYHNSKE